MIETGRMPKERTRRDSAPVVVIAALKDTDTKNPKILTSVRTSGLDTGDITLPGGRKKRGERTARTGVREWWEEVGTRIPSTEFLIGVDDDPILIETRAGQRYLHILFCYFDELFTHGSVYTKERHKNTQWRWRSLQQLEAMVKTNRMHPAVLERLWDMEDILLPAHIHGIPAAIYDFPHFDLHRIEELRAPLLPYRYPRTNRFPQ